MAYTAIDRVYSIFIDVMTGVSSGSGSATFYNTDNHTSYIELTVTNGNQLFDMTEYSYVLVVSKPNKQTYRNEYTTTDATKLAIEMDSQMLAGSGNNKGQLYIMKTVNDVAKVLTMVEFNYIVKEGNYTELAPESTNHDALYITLRNDVDNILHMIESGEIGGGGSGMTPTQKEQLTTAYNHAMSDAVTTTDEVNSAVATYVEANKSSLKGDKGDKGDKGEIGATGATGANGKDGLTTAISVNGETYSHVNGTITLPSYPTKTSQLANDSGFLTADSTIDADSLNGKKFSEPMTKQEYDSITEKDINTIYLVDDDSSVIGVPDYSVDDANKVLAVNDGGTALTWIDAPTGGVSYEEKYTTISFSDGSTSITLEDTVQDCTATIVYTETTTGDVPAFTNLFPYNPLSTAPTGVTGIQGYKGTLDFIGDNIIKYTATSDGGIFKSSAVPQTVVANHVYLYRSFVSTDNSTYTPHINKVVTATSEGTIPGGTFVINVSSIPNETFYYIKNPLIIDLTDLYGSGNEPTAEQMLSNIPEDVWCLGTFSPGEKETFTITSFDSLGETVDTFTSTDSDKTIDLKKGGHLESSGTIPSNLVINDVKNLIAISSGASTTKKTINLSNVDRLLFVGDSYTEGMYYQKGKAWVCQMSEQLDYTCESFGFGGNTCSQLSTRIKANEARFNAIGVKDLNPTRVMLMSFVNDMNSLSYNGTAYLEDLIDLIETVKFIGASPIVCSEFTNQWNSGFQESVGAYCRNNGIEFWNIQPLTSFIGIVRGESGNEYEPYMEGSHPAQRTGGIIFANYLKYARNLPRPISAIKIYRLRSGITVSNIDELLFTSRREKLLKFKELLIAHSALTKETDYDNLDSLTGSSGVGVKSEYGQLMSGNLVSFGDYGLVEVILPSTRNNIKSAKLNVSDTSITIYVKTKNGYVVTSKGAVSDLVNSVEYDKLTFLLYKQGGFSIRDISLTWTGTETPKAPTPCIEAVLHSGKELLEFNTVDDTSNYTVEGTVAPSEPTNYTKMPNGCTKLITVDNINYINVALTVPNAPMGLITKARIRVVARYNPAKGSSEINENSYDRKLLQIQPKGQQTGSTINRYTLTHEIDMAWTICEFDMELQSSTNFNIMSADSTPIEICYISVLEV